MALKMAGTSQIFELCENAPKVLHESYTPAVIRLGNNSERGIPRCEPSPSLRKTARPAAEVVPRGPASRTSLEPWGGLRALASCCLAIVAIVCAIMAVRAQPLLMTADFFTPDLVAPNLFPPPDLIRGRASLDDHRSRTSEARCYINLGIRLCRRRNEQSACAHYSEQRFGKRGLVGQLCELRFGGGEC